MAEDSTTIDDDKVQHTREHNFEGGATATDFETDTFSIGSDGPADSFSDLGGGGGRTKLTETEGIDSVSSISHPSIFDSGDAYRTYSFEVDGIGPNTAGEGLKIQVTTDDGATWDTESAAWVRVEWNTGNNQNMNRSRGGDIALTNDAGNDADRRGSVTADFRQPTADWFSSFEARCIGRKSSGNRYRYMTVGRLEGISGITGLRLIATTGTISAEREAVYGII